MNVPRKPRFFWYLAIVNIFAIPVLFYVMTQRPSGASGPQNAPLPSYGAVASFTLTESSGSILSSDELWGNPWVASFIFTNCPNQCPMMSHKMSLLQRALPAGAKLVSFSVDPERDSPQVMARYAADFKADNSRWFFLTGGKEPIGEILKSFHMNNAEDPNLHSLRFVLVDGHGQIRGYYDSSDKEALKKLSLDAQTLTEEAARV